MSKLHFQLTLGNANMTFQGARNLRTTGVVEYEESSFWRRICLECRPMYPWSWVHRRLHNRGLRLGALAWELGLRIFHRGPHLAGLFPQLYNGIDNNICLLLGCLNAQRSACFANQWVFRKQWLLLSQDCYCHFYMNVWCHNFYTNDLGKLILCQWASVGSSKKWGNITRSVRLLWEPDQVCWALT